MKYFIAYKYHRIEETFNEKNEKVVKQWDSYSSDALNLDFEIKSLEDVQRAEKYLYDLLNKEVIETQKVTALLLLSFQKLES